MTRLRVLSFVLLAWTLPCAVGAAPTSAATTGKPGPNVVFILVDDLGWGDLGCYGSDYYESPHIDRLARESLQFSAAYAAAPVCSPTRAAILTGKSPARLDMTIWHEGAVGGGPADRRLRDAVAEPNLPLAEVTLAEMFRDAGYFTAHVGKWHLGTAAFYPETQGYEISAGGTFWGAPATFFYPFSGLWNRRSPEIRYVPGLGPGAAGDYLPDRITDVALRMIESQQERPFFLSLWYYTVHSPIEAPEDIIERFRDKPRGRRHRDPDYAAMIQRMDHNVGRVLQKLDELSLSNNTIVVFTSDNGGVDIDVRGIVPTSNAPLRSGKGTLYEGGIRVPLLIRWPGKSAGKTGQLVTSQDFFPTLAELLEASELLGKGNEVRSDGVSLLPLLDDPATRLADRDLFWHFPHYYPRMTPGSAVRSGPWKLIHFYEDDRMELYNLETDPGETSDLAQAESARALDLRARLDQWRLSVGANAPTPNSR